MFDTHYLRKLSLLIVLAAGDIDVSSVEYTILFEPRPAHFVSRNLGKRK